MIPPKLVQALLLLLFLSVVIVSTFVILRQQLAPLLQDLGGATPAPVRVTTTASPQSAPPTTTVPPLTFARVATVLAVTSTHPSPVLAPTTTGQVGLVNSPVVNVRSAPSLTGEVVGQAKQGDRLEIIATSPDGQWLQVCCPLGTSEGNRPSWVAAELVTVQP